MSAEGAETRRLFDLFDLLAVARGTGVALAVASPVFVAKQVREIDQYSNLTIPFFLAYVVGFTLGGWVAARRVPDAPFSNGAMAALAAYAALALAASIIKVGKGDDLDPVGLLAAGFLAASMGILGGLISTWRRPSPAADPPPDTGLPRTRPG